MKLSTSFVAAIVAIVSLTAEAAPYRRGAGFVTSVCRSDSDCEQGCCAFNTGKCAGPDIAQTRDGGCGFGSPAPNCNVAAALNLPDCAPGAVNGDLSSPDIQTAVAFVAQLDNIQPRHKKGKHGSGSGSGAAPPAETAPATDDSSSTDSSTSSDDSSPAAAPAAPAGNAQATVFEPCTQDSDCQEGCCAFNTGTCAGPGIAQTRDGGCGFGSPAPNCNVAAVLALGVCAPGAVNGDLSDPTIITAAQFVSQLDNIPFPGSG